VTCYTQPCKPYKVICLLHYLPLGDESSPRGRWGICAPALPEVLTQPTHPPHIARLLHPPHAPRTTRLQAYLVRGRNPTRPRSPKTISRNHWTKTGAHGPQQLQVGVHATALRHPPISSTMDHLHRPRHSHTRPPPPCHIGPCKEDTAPPSKPLPLRRSGFGRMKKDFPMVTEETPVDLICHFVWDFLTAQERVSLRSAALPFKAYAIWRNQAIHK
jgi:hypothetical protein